MISTSFAPVIPSNRIALYSGSSLLSTLISSCKHYKISAATLDLFLHVRISPSIENRDWGTAENLYFPRYPGRSISDLDLAATKNRDISFLSALMLTSWLWNFIVTIYMLFAKVVNFLFFTVSQIDLEPTIL